VSNSEKVKLTRKVTVRFKPDEYNKVNVSFKATTKKKLSEYIRYVLLEKPVTVYTRDQSVDELMTELVRLRNELSAIGSNFNQLVKRLHTASHFQEIKALAFQAESDKEKFLNKANEINLKIAELSDKWWQE
jgi:uncharacterized protein YggL (DUF469 family)